MIIVGDGTEDSHFGNGRAIRHTTEDARDASATWIPADWTIIPAGGNESAGVSDMDPREWGGADYGYAHDGENPPDDVEDPPGGTSPSPSPKGKGKGGKGKGDTGRVRHGRTRRMR